MNASELKAALNTVEQDHQLVLDKMQSLKETVNGLLDPDGINPRSLVHRLRETNRSFATQLTVHMDEEETTLFPLLEKQKPGGPELVARLRSEHEEIRRKRAEFENCLEFADELEEGVSRTVLRDLFTYGWQLWETLDNHAHLETRAIHDCIVGAVGGRRRGNDE